MKDKFKLISSVLGEERIKFGEMLSDYTFSKIGGPAECFYIATNTRELIRALDAAYELGIPYFVFGNGTKILISDYGMKGLVLKNRTSNIKINGVKGKVGKLGLGIEEALVEADSGVSLGKLNEYLKDQNLKEIVGISSFSSTIGGAIFLDPHLGQLAQKVCVWKNGTVYDIELNKLKRNEHIVLSLVLKIKAKS